ADFTYARLMGAQEKVKTGYKPAELDQWAKRAKAWAKKGDAFWRPLRWSVSRRCGC
ncbi:MAG TPA: DUF72 domain-containing protein, partial [Reyranella sp.]|nr:DUF72 domain-containing protein [Reyranella sp.]